jgi:hypothetical protein
MHGPDALNDMLTMFSKNKLKQSVFVARMILNVEVIPFLRKAVGLSPKLTPLKV